MSDIKENFDEGAFVLSRSIFYSEIWFKPPEYSKIWIYLIGKVGHKDRRYKGYHLKRGQYFCDHAELKEQLKYNIGYRKIPINDSYVKNILKYLRDNHMITTTKKPRGIIVEVLNYNLYQDLSNYEKTNEKSYEKPSSNPGLNQDTPSINKNDKNVKKEKKKTYSPEIQGLSGFFFNTLPSNLQSKITDSEREKWNDCFDKLIRIDGHNPDTIRAVITYFRADSFWESNFLSPLKLRRKNRDGIKYIDFFKNNMKSTKSRASPQSSRAIPQDVLSENELNDFYGGDFNV
jgi:hypothetical protein